MGFDINRHGAIRQASLISELKAKRERVKTPHDCVSVVHSGFVFVLLDEIIVDILGPGSVIDPDLWLPETTAEIPKPAFVYRCGRARSQIRHLRLSQIVGSVEDGGEVGEAFLRATRVQIAQRLLWFISCRNTSMLNTEKRLHRAFRRLVQTNVAIANPQDSAWYDCDVKTGEIAEMIGQSREAVSRVYTQWGEDPRDYFIRIGQHIMYRPDPTNQGETWPTHASISISK